MPFCNKQDKNKDFKQFAREIDERQRIEDERNADRKERMEIVVNSAVSIIGIMMSQALKQS